MKASAVCRARFARRFPVPIYFRCRRSTGKHEFRRAPCRRLPRRDKSRSFAGERGFVGFAFGDNDPPRFDLSRHKPARRRQQKGDHKYFQNFMLVKITRQSTENRYKAKSERRNDNGNRDEDNAAALKWTATKDFAPAIFAGRSKE